MKIRTVLPVMYALGLLMITAISSSACPYDVIVKFDAASVTYDRSNPELTLNPVHGTIEYPADNPDGQEQFSINLAAAADWNCITKIDGYEVHDGDMITLTRGQSLSFEIIPTPNSNQVGSEEYCLTIKYEGYCRVGGNCLSLITTGTAATVSSDQSASNITLAPNPAGNYITAFGLNTDHSGSRYEIFSSTGAEVRYGLLPSDARINTEGLPSGAYRLRLFDAAQLYFTGAFTIVH